MEFKALFPTDYLRQPWQNGRGETLQLALDPPHATLENRDFLWRISSARVVESGDFSTFPDHDRLLILLNGTGLRLTHESDGQTQNRELHPFQPYSFRGDWRTRAELLGPPLQDFNVFHRRDTLKAQARMIELKRTQEVIIPLSELLILYCVSGTIRIETTTLERECTVIARASSLSERLPLVGEAPHSTLIAVFLQPIP